ncbi:Retrovirus-related Pol polyprotein from transposon 17.6 [Vitis vinifera]|uniref:Retrovirus-related Pol polyprotein from transposon 17.6 n=1 Tax=Vitis vinifera TaxID=29760 RepID=A0A438KBC1_VITVI|nr:Retrovirus-related Pol polyprotein from transposon 17.6 [Vitis vinifera]
MPKRQFPLPRIDQIVDSTAGQGMLSFLDAFSGYHQIPMSPADEEKTAFITPHGLYCYKVMPFGLKNVGATYQRLMTKIFKPLVGRTVEVYIDDIVVKSKTREEHVLHLQEVFHLLRKYGMKLNPSKCAFGVSAGKFLDLWSKKELQRLTGKLVALGRFIARFTDELRPFFLAIRKAGASGWTDSSPSLRKIVYVSGCIEWAISVVLFRCPSPKEQKPIYYVSRALADVETRYSKMELTALALRSAAQKLRPYFQAHPVVVLTDQPLRNILHKPDLTGRMLQWAIELSEYGIEFQPRLSMKGQVMADFVLEYSRKPIQRKEPSEKEWWTLRVDGASRSSGSGVGLLLQSPTGEHLEQAIRLGFPASNNEAEYEVILSGLDLALALSVSRLRVYSDSQLVVRHVQKEYEAKDARMARYLTKVRDTLQRFTEWTIEKIKRTENGRADALAGIAASLPSKKPYYCLYMCKPTLPSRKPPLAIPLRQAKQTAKSPISVPKPLRGLYVLAELHEGVCGNHSGGRSLAHRAHSQGYYWPTMKKDAAAYVKKCDKCQSMPHTTCAVGDVETNFRPLALRAVGHGHSRTPTSRSAQKKFLLVATITSVNGWKLKHTLASKTKMSPSSYGRTSSAASNPPNHYSRQRNGQAEATNKTLITALKKRLEQAKGKWVEELPGVLWAYRTTPGRPTGNTPFALAYGMDAVIPTEIGLPTIRTEAGRQDDANAELGRNLDWADEVRETASIRMADYQQRAAAHYNRKARPRSFKMERWFLESNGSQRDTSRLPASGIRLEFLPFRSKLSLQLFFLRASVASSRLFASASSIRRASLSSGTSSRLQHSLQRLSGQRISWLRPAPISSAIPLHRSCAGRRRPSCDRNPQQVYKKIVLLNHAANTAHQLQKNPQQEVQITSHAQQHLSRWNPFQHLSQLRIAERASGGASCIINGTPPDKALGVTPPPAPGPHHSRPAGSLRANPHPGPAPGRLGSLLPSPSHSPPDDPPGRMSS